EKLCGVLCLLTDVLEIRVIDRPPALIPLPDTDTVTTVAEYVLKVGLTRTDRVQEACGHPVLTLDFLDERPLLTGVFDLLLKLSLSDPCCHHVTPESRCSRGRFLRSECRRRAFRDT